MNDGSPSSSDDDPLGPVVESFLDRFRRGERPALTDLIARHPDLAGPIRELIPVLVEIEQLGRSAGGAGPGSRAGAVRPGDEGPPPERRGYYRILRPIGGGGMGVVYEAGHESLKNRVALKVMHPRFRADRTYLRRFHAEARLAAGLHHTNIVSVFDYGEQDGVCYYAMQFIHGQPLDLVLADIRRLRDLPAAAPGPEADPAPSVRAHSPAVSGIADGLLAGRFTAGGATGAPAAGEDTSATAPLPARGGGDRMADEGVRAPVHTEECRRILRIPVPNARPGAVLHSGADDEPFGSRGRGDRMPILSGVLSMQDLGSEKTTPDATAGWFSRSGWSGKLFLAGGLLGLMAAPGLLGLVPGMRGSKTDGTERGRADPARPLVTLLLRCPGPMAPGDKVFRHGEVEVEKPIPDGSTPGLESDLLLADAPDEPDGRIYSIDPSIVITHPRAADLTIALSAVSKDGKDVLKTEVLWDGPAAARGKPAAEADRLAPVGRISPNSLLGVRGCRRWRLSVADATPGHSGRLKKWGLTCRAARYAFAHDEAYYRRILFGDGRTRDPRPGPNAADYFREVSRGKVTYRDAGIYGPVTWEGWDGSSDAEQCAAAVRLLEEQGFDFRPFDADHDGVVAFDELTVLVIQNDGDAHDGRTRNNRGGTMLRRAPLRADPLVVFVPQQFDFMTLTHELAHALNPSALVDLYGVWSKESLSEGLTLMSATLGNAPDDKRSLYLDPWHRYRLGWIGLCDPGAVDRFEVRSERWVDAGGAHGHPMIVRRPGGIGSEYYIFEYRDGTGYDDGVNDRGIVAWHVRVNVLGLPSAGGGDDVPGHAIYAVGPGAERGGRRAWKPSDGKFRLRWADGTWLPATYWVEPSTPERPGAVLRWSTTEENHPPGP